MQVTEPGILVEPLWSDPWIVALPSAHVLAPARAVELAELAREPIALLALDAGGALERRVVECLGSVDPRAAISERPSNVAALLMWVEAGCGVGLLSASQAQVLACTSAAIKPLRRGLPSAEVRLLRGDAPASSPLSRLIESLRANSA
jgi:DNA-binding transcriptional LysR family regulator